MKKRFLTLIISGLMLFSTAGCVNEKESKIVPESTIVSESSYVTDSTLSQAEELSENRGKYVEKNISLGDTIVEIDELFLLNGKPAFTGSFIRGDFWRNNIYVGNQRKDLFCLQSAVNEYDIRKYLSHQQFDYCDLVCSPMGDYIITFRYNNRNNVYLYFSSSGDIKELTLNNEYGIQQLRDFKFSSDNRLFAKDYNLNSIYEIDVENDSVRKIFECEEYIMKSDIIDDYIIIINSAGITLYNYRDGKKEETPPALQNFIKEKNFKLGSNNSANGDFCEGDDGAFYFADATGLYRYVMGGNLVEQMMDGLCYSISNLGYTVDSVLQDTDGSFLVSYKEHAIMRYYFDKNAFDDIQSYLKIYSLTENNILRNTISIYKKQNPSVEIEYEVGMKDYDPDLYQDAVAQLQKEIISENPPDIIMLDGLNIYNMAENGFLSDLSGNNNEIDQENALFDNIAGWARYKDGLYGMACRFRLPVLIGTSDKLDKINSFSSFADTIEQLRSENPESAILNLNTEEEIIENALVYNGSKIISDNKIQKEELLNMLQSCKKICDNNISVFSDEQIKEYSMFKEICDDSIINIGNAQFVLTGYLQLGIGTAGQFRGELFDYQSYEDAGQSIVYHLGLSETDNSFLPVCSLGICSSGKNYKNAIGFLKTAFSDECQYIDIEGGFPVNENSFNKLSGCEEDEGSYGSTSIMHKNGQMLQVPYQISLNKENKEELQNTINNLDAPVALDVITKNTIITVGKDYINGKLSAEDAVAEIIRKLA